MFNELDEALFVASQINLWLDEGGKLEDCAILYRSNRLSRVIEDSFNSFKYPFIVFTVDYAFSNVRKRCISILRLIANRQDDAAFERIVNTPLRGLGSVLFWMY